MLYIYARLQIFIQLSPTLTKLCHIKRDYPLHHTRVKKTNFTVAPSLLQAGRRIGSRTAKL